MQTRYITGNLDKIKVIIFDFDETLYYSPNILKLSLDYKRQALIDMKGCTPAEADELLARFGYTLENKHAEAFGNNMANFGLTEEIWNEYKKVKTFVPPANEVKVLSNELLRRLASKYKLYIVSRDIYENIVMKCKLYKIDLSNFSAVICPRAENNYFTPADKSTFYSEILRENDISASQAIVFGDRYKVDIAPMLALGGNGVQIQTITDLKNALNELSAL